MKYYLVKATILKCLVIILLISCKKEKDTSTLFFTSDEKKWFIYEVGNKVQFTTAMGDSLNYKVIDVNRGYKAQYAGIQPNSPILGQTEFYSAILAASSDTIFIHFYKEFLGGNPNKMKQTIRWNTFKSQFAELEAIEKGTPFIKKTVNGVLYDHVTPSFPVGGLSYSFTRFNEAYYDQKYGFIEISDTANVVWSRVRL